MILYRINSFIQIFCDGDVCWFLQSSRKEIIDAVEGSPTELSLKAILSGEYIIGHQLFRQNTDDQTEKMTLKIYFS